MGEIEQTKSKQWKCKICKKLFWDGEKARLHWKEKHGFDRFCDDFDLVVPEQPNDIPVWIVPCGEDRVPVCIFGCGGDYANAWPEGVSDELYNCANLIRRDGQQWLAANA